MEETEGSLQALWRYFTSPHPATEGWKARFGIIAAAQEDILSGNSKELARMNVSDLTAVLSICADLQGDSNDPRGLVRKAARQLLELIIVDKCNEKVLLALRSLPESVRSKCPLPGPIPFTDTRSSNHSDHEIAFAQMVKDLRSTDSEKRQVSLASLQTFLERVDKSEVVISDLYEELKQLLADKHFKIKLVATETLIQVIERWGFSSLIDIPIVLPSLIERFDDMKVTKQRLLKIFYRIFRLLHPGTKDGNRKETDRRKILEMVITQLTQSAISGRRQVRHGAVYVLVTFVLIFGTKSVDFYEKSLHCFSTAVIQPSSATTTPTCDRDEPLCRAGVEGIIAMQRLLGVIDFEGTLENVVNSGVSRKFILDKVGKYQSVVSLDSTEGILVIPSPRGPPTTDPSTSSVIMRPAVITAHRRRGCPSSSGRSSTSTDETESLSGMMGGGGPGCGAADTVSSPPTRSSARTAKSDKRRGSGSGRLETIRDEEYSFAPTVNNSFVT